MRKESDFWRDYSNPADDFGSSMDYGGPSYEAGYDGHSVVMPEKKKGHGAIVVLLSMLAALIPTAMLFLFVVLPLHMLLTNPLGFIGQYAGNAGGQALEQFAGKFIEQYEAHGGNVGDDAISDYVPGLDPYFGQGEADQPDNNDSSHWNTYDSEHGESDSTESNEAGTYGDTSEDYILPQSSTQYLTNNDVAGMTLREVNYAKNEIYARRGRRFKSSELQSYFDSKSWYIGRIDADQFDQVVTLTDVEKKNTEFLSEVEHSMDPNGYQPAN